MHVLYKCSFAKKCLEVQMYINRALCIYARSLVDMFVSGYINNLTTAILWYNSVTIRQLYMLHESYLQFNELPAIKNYLPHQDRGKCSLFTGKKSTL